MKAMRQGDNFAESIARAMAAGASISESATVGDGLARWLQLHSLGNKSSTVDYNTEILATMRAKWPGLETPIKEVTVEQCIAFATAIAHYSPSRFNGMVNAIKTFIPAAKFLPRKKYQTDITNKIPTPNEFDRLLAALDTAQSGKAGLVVRLLAHTGLRINEARQITWPDVRSDHLYIRAEVSKNGKPRTVPFVPGTRDVLSALKRYSRRAGNVLPQTGCFRALRYAARLTGLPTYGHHTFRHYFATRCILSGVDIPTVAKWVGHVDNGALLLRVYCHLIDEHSLAMAARVKVGGSLANPEACVQLHSSRDAAQSVTNLVTLPEAFFANGGQPQAVEALPTVAMVQAPATTAKAVEVAQRE